MMSELVVYLADSVSFVAWSEDDKWLLSGGNDLVVKLWDTSTGQLIRDFMGHTEAVTAIAWSQILSCLCCLAYRFSFSMFQTQVG